MIKTYQAIYNPNCLMNFFPKNPKFFDLFEDLARIVNSGGDILPKIKIRSKNIVSYAKKARQLEHQADTICHTLYHEADSTFITPIDREDIHLLSRNLDNIIDLIENLTSNILLYGVTREIAEFKNFTKVISQTTVKILQLVSLLKKRDKNVADMRKLIIEIHSLENEGDNLIRRALKHLFTDHKNLVVILKWKDLFENMEEILDECENTADIVEEIIVKNF